MKLFSFKKEVKQTVTVADSSKQDLDLYWDPKMADLLEIWGEENVWNEIQMFFSALSGTVLDIACGTGITTIKLNKFDSLKVFGCDISDLLIDRAIEKGIDKNTLTVCDATEMPYADNQFDYSFSIGSLEHFTDEGIDKFISEARRVTSKASFHMLPTSKSKVNEGWMKTLQSFHNNNNEWWIEKFSKSFTSVIPLRSKWEDRISDGYWFVCK